MELLMLFCISCFLPYSEAKFAIVRTERGLLRGLRRNSSFLFFGGVPYAQPPVKSLRFRNPREVFPWLGVRNVTKLPSPCPQKGLRLFDEDCLYLNVYTPALQGEYPVWVWIHGGDFSRGSSSLEDPSEMSQNGIVVVTIQYRIGPFGFASLNSSINIGYKDQEAALNWVEKNIRRFGGDPTKIVLGGSGAGGFSASRLARNGKYSGLVLASGGWSKDNLWYTISRDEAQRRTKKLGSILNCGKERNLIDCLRTKSTNEILEANINFLPESDPLENSTFESEGFPDNFSILIGDTKYEGSADLKSQLKLFFLSSDEVEDLKIDKSMFQEIVAKLFPNYSVNIINTISFFYTNWTTPEENRNYLDSLVKIISDSKYKCPVDFAANTMAKKFKVFRYTLEKKDSWNLYPTWAGVKHIKKLPVSFLNKTEIKKRSQERLKQFMVQSWSNFIKQNHPTDGSTESFAIGWPEYKVTTRYKILLNPEMLEIVSDDSVSSCSFWNELLPKLQNKNDAPCNKGTAALLKDESDILRLDNHITEESLRDVRKNDENNTRTFDFAKDEEAPELGISMKNSTTVSYRINVLNSPHKMIYERPGNSPIFISSRVPDRNTNEVARDGYEDSYLKYRTRDTNKQTLRSYYNDEISSALNRKNHFYSRIYDPFFHQVRSEDVKDSNLKRNSYYPL